MKENNNLFVGREKELSTVSGALQRSLSGASRHMAYFGLPKIGTTSFLKEVQKMCAETQGVASFYFDFKKLVTTPEDFTRRFAEEAVKQINADMEDAEGFVEFPVVLEQLKNDARVSDYFSEYAKLNRVGKFKLLLRFPSYISLQLQKKPILILDNFSEVFHLSYFKDINHIGKLLTDSLFQKAQFSVLGCGYDQYIHDVMSVHVFPLERLQFYRLGSLTASEAMEYFEESFNDLSEPIFRKMERVTIGHPYYMRQLTEQWKVRGLDQEKDVAPLFEQMLADSFFSDYFEQMYEIVLLKARYYGPLKLLLRFLASREGLFQRDIIQYTGASQGVVRNYLTELEKFYVIYRREGRYYFVDSVFRKWILMHK